MKIRYKYGIDKEAYKEDIEFIQKAVRSIGKALNMEDWRLTVEFKSKHPDDTVIDTNLLKLADTEAEGQYKSGYIRFFLDSMRDKDETREDNFETILHEMMHCVVSLMASNIEEQHPKAMQTVAYAEEVLVTHLEKLPIWKTVFAELNN